MTDSQGGEAAVVETTTGAEEAPVSSERDYEAEARKAGWKPQEEFAGDKSRWKDAKAWVEFGELRDSIRKDVDAEYKQRFTRLEKVIKQGYEQQIADLKAQKTAAVKAGNVELVEKIDKAIDETKEVAKDEGNSPVEDHNTAFKKRGNDWYGDDEDLTALAVMFSNAVSQAYTLKNGRPMPDELMFEAVERKVRATPEYKAKFGDKPAANGHAAVDGGSDSPAAAPSKSPLFAKLPPEAKAQCAKDVKAGLYKTNEAWAEAYFS